jgi:hypothetical protein
VSANGRNEIVLAKPAGAISLTQKQKLNIGYLSYGQAIKNEIYTADVIYGLWPTELSQVRFADIRPSITAIQQYQSTPEFRSDMAERGIEVDGSVGELTQDQLACISVLTDFTDRRGLTAKLRALGISSAKYRGWLRQKPFNDAIRSLAGRGLDEAIPMAEVALSEKAANGDLKAIQFLMEVTGRHNPSQQQAIDAQQLVAIMVDVAQEVMAADKKMLEAFITGVKFRAQSIKGVVL